MARKLAIILALACLSGCISSLDSAYDDRARRQCENSEARDRGDCLDRVDRHRQERDRD